MYNNSTYKLISSPHFGYIWGSYNRHTDTTSFKGDTKSLYYGLTNELSRDIALEHFILEPNLEFNIAGLYNDTIKDEQGLNVNSHNDISAEIGIGLYIKKRLEFAKKRSLSMRVGGGTYLELLNPYKTLKGSIPGMMGSYNFNKRKNNRNRSVLKTSIKYKQNNLDLIGELNKLGYEIK
jgi:outer membrane autotransporter protein